MKRLFAVLLCTLLMTTQALAYTESDFVVIDENGEVITGDGASVICQACYDTMESAGVTLDWESFFEYRDGIRYFYVSRFNEAFAAATAPSVVEVPVESALTNAEPELMVSSASTGAFSVTVTPEVFYADAGDTVHFEATLNNATGLSIGVISWRCTSGWFGNSPTGTTAIDYTVTASSFREEFWCQVQLNNTGVWHDSNHVRVLPLSEKPTDPDPTPTTYTVTFNSNGGTSIDPQTVESGSTITAPATPTQDGYTFSGWYLDGSPYDFNTPVTADITLTAQWTATGSTTPPDPTDPDNPGGGGSITPVDPDPIVPDNPEILTGLKALVVSLFGEYTPVTTKTPITEEIEGIVSITGWVTTVAEGAAGVDYEWIAGVLLFAIMLSSFMKLVGVLLKQ